jgi:hypothetical protein
MARTYRNRWIPQQALDILATENGAILDLGGGASPYYRASHVADIIPFDAASLRANAWGGEAEFRPSQYTAIDICTTPLPFDSQSFALGLCSHTLEDLRDPLPALSELGRVCKRILVICPSRLVEQTRGIDHPRYCGFFHHPWAVSRDKQGIAFRRKTSNIELPRCHIVCPYGKTLTVDAGTFVYYGERIDGREVAYWDSEDDAAELQQFLEPYRGRRDLFVWSDRPFTARNRVYYWRRKYLGVS